MAKVQIKSEKPTPFGAIFSIMEQIDTLFAAYSGRYPFTDSSDIRSVRCYSSVL